MPLAPARARAAERDVVLLDRECLAVDAGPDQDRVARLRRVDRGLDRLSGLDAVDGVAAAACGGQAGGGSGGRQREAGEGGGELQGGGCASRRSPFSSVRFDAAN